MKKQNFLLILIIFTSVFIYVFYRTDQIIINQIIISIFSAEKYHAVKETSNAFLPLHSLIVYSLPEGLWILWITSISRQFYIEINDWKINCGWIPLLYAVGLEIIQLLHFTNGTFDWLDLMVAVVFWIPAYFGFRTEIEKQNIFSTTNSVKWFCLSSYVILYFGDLCQ